MLILNYDEVKADKDMEMSKLYRRGKYANAAKHCQSD